MGSDILGEVYGIKLSSLGVGGGNMGRGHIIGEKLEENDRMENRGLQTCRLKHTPHHLHISSGEKLCPRLCNVGLQS